MPSPAPSFWDELARPRFEVPRSAASEPADVDVWRVDLALEPPVVEHLRGFLAAEEKARAARLADPALARRYVVRRGRLRQILAPRVRLEPGALTYERGRHGRPHLVSVTSPPEFSATDSADLALVAVTSDHPVGIDIERLRAVEQAETIARRWFPAEEHAAWTRLVPLLGRDRAFLWFWTRLEARVKRRGRGIFDPDREGDAQERAEAPEPWMFEPAPGFIAALAGPPPGAPLRWREAGRERQLPGMEA